MSRIVRSAVLGAALLCGSTAMANTVVSPDDICAPGADPCVIDEPYQITHLAPLDFGLRKVVVTAEGRLTGDGEISCGGFTADVQGRWMQLEGSWRSVEIRARRTCSLQTQTPCLEDDECSALGLGTCSAGDGSISVSGEVFGMPGGLGLIAAGGVAVRGTFQLSGNPGEDGGGLYAESTRGSIDVDGSVYVDAGPIIGARNGAGMVRLLAHENTRVRGLVSARGGQGSLEVGAGGDVIFESSIDARGVSESDFDGAMLTVDAARDLFVRPAPGQTNLIINMRGGGYIDADGSVAGNGGEGRLRAGRNLHIAAGVRIVADSGRILVRPEREAESGSWSLDAAGDLEFEGTLLARGRGPTGLSLGATFHAGSNLTLGLSSVLNLRSRNVEELRLTSGASLDLHGRINVRGGRRRDRYGDRTGDGGTVLVDAGNVSMTGTIDTGGGRRGGYLRFDVCRLRLFPGARIDASHDDQELDAADVLFFIRDRMTADPASLVAARPESPPYISYRDETNPPRLLGSVSPEPQTSLNATMAGCLPTAAVAGAALLP